MQRLQKWLSRHKKVMIMVTATALLAIPLALTACGSAASEDTERPKTPFELESMIQSSEADIQDIRGDIESMNVKLNALQNTASHDWSAEITAIQSQLVTITAKLNALANPTPQPTTPGGQPHPTQPPSPSGQSIYLNPSDKFYKTYTAELVIRAGSTDITNPVLNIKFESATEVSSPSISFDIFLGGISQGSISSTYSSTGKTVQMYQVTTTGVFVPSGSTVTGTVNFSCVNPVFWTPSVILVP